MISQTQKEKTLFNDLLIKKLCNDKNYIINLDGSILTLIQKTGKKSKNNSWRVLKPLESKDGYHSVRYNYKYLKIHRIVYQKFVSNLDANLQINHIDGNKLNNHFSNLEMITQSENMKHMYRYKKNANRTFEVFVP